MVSEGFRSWNTCESPGRAVLSSRMPRYTSGIRAMSSLAKISTRKDNTMLYAIRNRTFIFSFLFLLATSGLCAADLPPATPDTQSEKVGYTFGYRLGAGIRTDDLDVDFESVFQGFRDAMDGKQPLLDSEEMKNLIQELRAQKREAEMRKFQETIVKNQEEADKFLAENRKKEGVRTTESGLQYKILKDGDGVSPKQDDFVKVHYRGTFIDGTEFDNSYGKGAPQTVQTDGVIPGWTEALQKMKVGSKWQIFVPPDIGYGRRGLGAKIPPNKVLVFELELLSIENKK